MSEEVKSLLTLLGIIFLSAGVIVALICWVLASGMDDD